MSFISCSYRHRNFLPPAAGKGFSALILAFALCWLPGCAATTTFIPYPEKIAPVIAELKQGRQASSPEQFLQERQGMDLILYNMELGRKALLLGESDTSRRYFAGAMEKIAANEQKAIISASGIGSRLAAVTLNDNAIPYEGDGYERVMLHSYQALNYLALLDQEGAAVEIRLANAEQEKALRNHEDELDEARQEAAKKRLGNPATDRNLLTTYAQLDEAAGNLKNSFQNAFTFYLSGFIYEKLKLENDAYIDYKRALEIYPDNRLLQKDVLRLAALLDMGQDIDELRARFGPPPPPINSSAGGDILVIYEDGLVPVKQQVMIPLPVPRVGLVAIAFPIYNPSRRTSTPLTLLKKDVLLGRTEMICDMRALAVKSLREKVPLIATRQVIRAAAKGAAASAAKDQLGPLGQMLMSIWNIVSETADLRSWLSLPESIQIMRTTLPAGAHHLSFSSDAVPGTDSLRLTVSPASKTIIHIARIGSRFYTRVIPL